MMLPSRLAAAALLAFVLVQPAPGQDGLQPPERPPEPPKEMKRPSGRTDLDRLFSLLQHAPDTASAKLVEARIWSQWFQSGSDTADLLMARARIAMDDNDTDVALELLDALVAVVPHYVEAWNRRATVNYMRKDFGSALHDVAETLAREPRHFGALVGLGLILQEIGQDKKALEAFRQALSLNPHLERVPDLIKQLTPKVEGREI
ncbi:MAG: tetratricopeptide repeat protein [Methylacidiphilales bacterium]|nr:tetratricopeptide repeat protein [Candidatus Methylacidiphilales bacterium]